MGLFHEVKCGKCDRRYSSIRSRCPYCGARKSQAGRAATKDHNGTQMTQQIIGIVILIIVIVAVVVLVASSLKGRDETPDPSPSNSISGSGGVHGVEGSAPPTTPDTPPESTPPVEETPTPTPTIIINSITLNREDFTMSRIGETWDLEPVISPAGADVVIEWRSTDPTVASVDENGIVTAVDRGTVTVTATVGDVQAKCIVRINADAPSTPDTGSSSGSSSGSTGESSGSTSGTASLSHTDVTINAAISETFRLTVSGSSETPSYSVGNSSVATVDSNGKVTAVGEGTTTVTVKVGEQELECIVRVRVVS